MSEEMSIKDLERRLNNHESHNKALIDMVVSSLDALKLDLDALRFVMLDKTLRNNSDEDKEEILNKMMFKINADKDKIINDILFR